MERSATRLAAAAVLAALYVTGVAAPAHAAPTPSPSSSPSTSRGASPAGSAPPSGSASPRASSSPSLPPPVGDALAAEPLSEPVLTLPDRDGVRDVLMVRIRSGASGAVDVVARRGTRTVRVAAAVDLKRSGSLWQRVVRVPVTGLDRGGWTLEVRRTAKPAVLVRTRVSVGSGEPTSVRIVPVSRTLQPYRDGVLDAVDATVLATDETGAALPVSGTLRLDAGSKHATGRLRAGRAVLPVTAMPLGKGVLTAEVTVFGKAFTRTAAVTLAPTAVGTLRLTRSSDTVQPVVDGLLDQVVLGTSGVASGGSPAKVAGRLTVSGPSGVVQSWPVADGTARTFEWNGRVRGRIVPGVYTATLTLRGPQGPAAERTTTVTVSAEHLPWRVRDLFPVAPGNQQGLAVHDGIFYVGYDNGDGTARIERYDSQGNRFPLTLSPLGIGHAAELAFSTTTGLLYAVNGGASTPTKVWALEPQAADGASALRGTWDLSRLGNSGMIAVDDAHARLLVFAGSAGAYTVTPMTLTETTTTNPDGSTTTVPAGTMGTPQPITVRGTPQGMDVVGNRLWVYTSFTNRNHVARFDLTTMAPEAGSDADVMNPGEGEGLAALLSTDGTSQLFVGAHGPNRVGVLEPVPNE